MVLNFLVITYPFIAQNTLWWVIHVKSCTAVFVIFVSSLALATYTNIKTSVR